MARKILYYVTVIVIAAGAIISYKQLDFGGKTSIFFKIAFGDSNQMMQGPRKVTPSLGGESVSLPPEGFGSGHSVELEPGRGEEFKKNGEPGFQGPPIVKRGHGKPGMGKTISLAKVIPYFFIFSFFVLVTIVIDRLTGSIKKEDV